MSDPDPTPTQHAERDWLRIELLAQLPEIGIEIPAGLTLRGLAEATRVPLVPPADEHFDPIALTDWVLERFDAAVHAAEERVMQDYAAQDDRMIELANAAAVATGEVAHIKLLRQVSAILRRGLSIRDATDLAKTLDEHAENTASLVRGIHQQYPMLGVVPDEVQPQRPGLILPG